jgi:crotonobetainyl-CoA:carnitine CoA-transferase CaiB-like acyl-CoA transferase
MVGGCSARFLALNRGKRVVEADLKSAPGRRTALRLARSADVFLQNWPPGRAARFGLDPGALAAVRPSLVYAHAGGWADALPAPQPLGTDYLVQAYTGVAALLTGPDASPTPTLMTITDVLGAVISAEGVLAALLARSRTGVGVRAETALVDAARLIRDSATTLTDPITPSEDVAGTARPAAAVVTDLAAMAADPAYSAALDIGDDVTYSGAPWTFAPPASIHPREVTPP